MSAQVLRTRLSVLEARTGLRKWLPPLDGTLHKGQSGRVCVLGGGGDYTGAPYFSAGAALNLGADMVHVFCDKIAGSVIKSFSPDLIVHPHLISTYSANEDSTELDAFNWLKDSKIFEKINVLAVGPGLSRDTLIQKSLVHILKYARELNLPIVVDADGLGIFDLEPKILFGYDLAILTPNHNEFSQLCRKFNVPYDSTTDKLEATKNLSEALGGMCILHKEALDCIVNNKFEGISNKGTNPKRCGGQGDLLTGAIATFLFWGLKYHNISPKTISPDQKELLPLITASAALSASWFIREASGLSFKTHKRSLSSVHIMDDLSKFMNIFENEDIK